MSFSNIKVSVIITTYKRPNMLSNAIKSVLNQTYHNIEVIVVDDNNPESEYRKETENLMKQYLTNERIKYIKHNENKNGAAARNTGLFNSTGDVVCFLDDDDLYKPNKLELQLEYLLNNKYFDAVYCGWYRENKTVLPKLEGDLSFELLSGISIVYTSTIMMWRDVAISIGGWDERFKRNQEAVFLLRFFKNNYKIGVVSQVLVELDTSDRSNVLDARMNKEQFDLYLISHEDMIAECEKKIKNARKIIYSYRYRGVLLGFLKNKDFLGVTNVYLSMLRYIPLRFNLDIGKYLIKKLFLNRYL